jgi:hypothetical protein
MPPWQLFGLTGKLTPRHKLTRGLVVPEGYRAVASGTTRLKSIRLWAANLSAFKHTRGFFITTDCQPLRWKLRAMDKKTIELIDI